MNKVRLSITWQPGITWYKPFPLLRNTTYFWCYIPEPWQAKENSYD